MPEPFSMDELLRKNSEDLELPFEIYLTIAKKAVAESRHELPELERAVLDGNFGLIQTFTHKMKGTCGTVQLNMIAIPAGKINTLAKNGEGLERIRELFVQLKEVISAINI